MITTFILIVMAIALIAAVLIFTGVVGSALLLVFGDLIVFIGIIAGIVMIVKFFKRKK